MPFFFAPPPAPDVSQLLQLVTPSRITIAQLHANFPPGPDYLGKFCQVSDLWGAGIRGNMRCGYNGRIYYWEATTQPQLITSVPMTGDMTLQPMSSSPIVEFTGSVLLGVTRTITLGTQFAFPGQPKEIKLGLSSLVGNIVIAGLGLGSGVAGVLGATPKFVCIDTGSALEWRRVN